MNKQQYGFTLIELMIVVAIVGILASVALPAYQNYTKRAYISEGYTLASSLKTNMTEYYSTTGEFTDDLTKIGFNSAESFRTHVVQEINISDSTETVGKITIVFGQKISGDPTTTQQLVLKAEATNGAIIWKCDPGTDVKKSYLNKQCLAQVSNP